MQGIIRSCAWLIVIMLCLATGSLSAAAQEPAQTQQGVTTTFAPTVEKVTPSVVTVFTTQTVSRGLTSFRLATTRCVNFSADNLRRGKANRRCKVSGRA